MYHEGQGVPQSDERACAWWEKSAELGHKTAMHNLGSMYLDGKGVPQDFAKARGLFEQAAERGDVDAMVNLGVMYKRGQSVAQDFEKAHELYEQAAELGNAMAMYNLGLMLHVSFDKMIGLFPSIRSPHPLKDGLRVFFAQNKGWQRGGGRGREKA